MEYSFRRLQLLVWRNYKNATKFENILAWLELISALLTGFDYRR